MKVLTNILSSPIFQITKKEATMKMIVFNTIVYLKSDPNRQNIISSYESVFNDKI